MNVVTKPKHYQKFSVLRQSPKHPHRKNLEKPKLGESNNKIARKEKAAKNLMKNSSKSAGRKIWGLLRVHQPQSLGRLGRIQEVHVRKT